MSEPTGQDSVRTARSLFDKVWDQHVVSQGTTGLDLIAIDRTFLHERTGSIALNNVRERAAGVASPARVFATIDHIVDTRPGRSDVSLVPGGEDFIVQTRRAALSAGIRLFDVNDPEQGIVHVISPELGLALPGLTIVCPDSHTCTQGALGALAWGIGSTEAEHALVTGTLRVRKPRSFRIRFEGTLTTGTSAKDLSLRLLADHGAAGGAGSVIEYGGSAVTAMSIEARLTLCNMTTEFSAMTGLIAPDEKTFEYLAGRRYAPVGSGWDQALAHWRTLPSDDGAVFDREILIDAATIAPMVTWGTSPQQAVSVTDVVPDFEHSGTNRDAYSRAIGYMDLQPGTRLSDCKIDGAFIGSCTNSRLSDLRNAARILDGRHVAPGVRALAVPGSTSVKRAAEAEGLHHIFLAAGFEWRESGCSLCFNAGGESFGRQERVISSTNRNFESRQGPLVRSHLASPATVAASAIRGYISDPRTCQ